MTNHKTTTQALVEAITAFTDARIAQAKIPAENVMMPTSGIKESAAELAKATGSIDPKRLLVGPTRINEKTVSRILHDVDRQGGAA